MFYLHSTVNLLLNILILILKRKEYILLFQRTSLIWVM
nr:MAG TPA: hypothetical protein [Bacteriophage sp.]